MSILQSVTSGKKIGPQIHAIVGNNGVGKTTWAANFPKPLIVDLEKGSEHLNVARIPGDKITDFSMFRSLLSDLANKPHDYLSVAIDSAEALEGLIGDAVCIEGKVKSIEEFGGGYGKGYVRTRELMRDVFSDFRALQAKGITVIIVAHSQVKQHNDPATNQTYDRVIMRCNDKMAAIIRDLSDNVFYATYKVFLNEEKGKVRAYGDGQRVMYTQWRPGYDAKNRLELPLEIPLSYDAFIEACANSEIGSSDIISDINSMAEKVDDALKKSVKDQVEKYKNNPAKLKEIKNRLMKYVA